jgi:pimeloyl-ACP methyl ester carboxylesterase
MQDINIFKFDDNFIAYKQYKSKNKKLPTIIFHHGLMSDMEGKKALFLEKYCKENDINFLKFDNLGHGKSSGEFTKQTIGGWVESLKQILDNIVQGDFILVGSSMGGWVSLVAAEQYKERLKGLLLLAPAPDFTENSIWNKMMPDQQAYLMQHGIIEFGDDECKYPISYELIIEARKHLMLRGKLLNYHCPVEIIQGKQDKDVPYMTAVKLLEVINAPQTSLKLLQQSGHSLSSEKELKIIAKALDEIMNH